MPIDLDEFLAHYVACALWSSTDDDGEPLDANYSADDIAPESLAKMREDCASFVAKGGADIAKWESERWTAEEMAGHDFWLTRNGHGAGFWDGDWEEEAGKALTALSKKFGQQDLYVGDDGKLYV